METKQNVKSVISTRQMTAQGVLIRSCICCTSRCSIILRRHGGLVRWEGNTIRYRCGPYRYPCCAFDLSVCSPRAQEQGVLQTIEPLWHQDLEHYILLVGMHGIPEENRPRECPNCRQREHLPHRHSHFKRWVSTIDRSELVCIFRFRCPDCSYVHSVIPAFLEPYQSMALDLQEDIIDSVQQGATLEATAEETDHLPGGSFTEKTIWRLVKKWNERLAQLETGLWPWLITRIPHLNLLRSSSLWTALRSCWETVRQQLAIFRPIRFLHGLNRLYLSLAVAGDG